MESASNRNPRAGARAKNFVRLRLVGAVHGGSADMIALALS